MSRSGHLRRQAHRAALTPRRAWRRTYSYRADRAPEAGLWATMYSAESHDAQFGPQDARFWDWVAFGVIATIIIGFAVWVILASV